MCSHSLKRKWGNVKIMCILGWLSFLSSRGWKTTKGLCLFGQNDFHEMTCHPLPLPRLGGGYFPVVRRAGPMLPPPWGAGAAIRTYFTKILTGQEYHKQKRGNRFLWEIRISFCSIHSQGTQLPKAIWQGPEKQNEPQKRWWGEEGGGATTRLYFSVSKKSLEGWMRTGRLTYALIREH